MSHFFRCCPKEVNTGHDEVRDPHNIRPPHEQLHNVLSRAKQGRIAVPHNLHGMALKQKVPLIMHGRTCLQVRKLGGGAPVVGSSRKRMEGEEMSAHAMFSRRFSPPDRPRTRMPPGSAPPTWITGMVARFGHMWSLAWCKTTEYDEIVCCLA